MKTLNILSTMILTVAVGLISYGQNQIAPLEGINYQAVAIDEEGKEIVGMDIENKPLYEKEIGVRFTIDDGPTGSTVYYQDEHVTNTDKYGLFSLTIGLGTNTGAGMYDSLLNIPWINGDQWLMVEISQNNDGNYSVVSHEKFRTVPYAFYTDDIADNSITTYKIVDETIQAVDIDTGAVETSEILNETILAEDIATGAVTTDEILDSTILNEDIADGSIDTRTILNGTILNEDIADGTIDLTTKVTGILPAANGGTGLDGSAAANGQVLIGNGSGYSLNTLTPGTGINIINTAGGIEIESTIVGLSQPQSQGVLSPPPIPNGGSWLSPAIPMTAGTAPVGAIVLAALPVDYQGLSVSAYVRVTDQVRIVIENQTGATVDLPNGITPLLVVLATP